MKRFLSITLTITTIVWLSGFALLLPAFKASAEVTIKEGDLIRGPDGIKVYIVNDKAHGNYAGWKRHIFNPQVFNMYKHFSWNSIKSVTQAQLDSYETSDVYRADGDTKVYLLEEIDEASGNAVKHWFNMTAEQFVAEGYSWDQVFIVNSVERDFYVTGSEKLPGGGQQSAQLSVSLAADNPAARTVPQKATNITALKFTLNGSATVTGLTFKRLGVGKANDFENVYLYEGATRLTSGKTINSTSDEVVFTNLGLSVSGSKTLSLVVDMDDDNSPSTGNVNYFQLKAIETAATVSGLPISGNAITVGGSAVGSLTVEKGATPTNPKVGQVNVQISEFKISASTEDANIQRISLYQAGTISRSNLSNLKLYQGGVELASVASINSKDLIVFDLSANPFKIEKGNSRIFVVKADIGSAAKPNDRIKTYIDTAADVYGIGATYGYGMTVDISSSGSFDGSGTNYIEVSVSGGTVTVSTSGPIASTVSKRAKDYDFFDFSINSAANIDIKTLRLEMHAVGTDLDHDDTTVASNYITDIKIWDTDKNIVVAGPVDISSFSDIGSSAGVYYLFTNFDSISAGATKHYKVTVDLSNSLATGSQLYVTLGKAAAPSYTFDSTHIKNTDNNQYVTDIVPNTALSGKYMTLSAASLTLGIASSPVASTYIRGTKNVPSLGLSLTAGDGSDIKITQIKITGYVSDKSTISESGVTKSETGTLKLVDMIEQIKLYDGDTQLGDAKAFSSGGVATFDNFTYTVPAGSTKTLTVKADISSSVNVDGGTANYAIYAFDIDDASEDIASTDVENNDIDPTSDNPNGTETNSGTATTMYIIVAESGSLSNSQDSGRPNSAIQIAGSSNVLFNKVKFTASNEEFKITKMRVKIDNSNAADDVTGVRISDGTTTWGPVSLVGGNADFSNLSIIVPKDGHKVVSIYADLNTISGGADSGDTFSLDFDYDNNFEAVATGSNTKVTSATADSNGNDMVIAKTQPTITALALPSTNLINGTMVLYKFKVEANAGADVSIKKIHFDVLVNDADSNTLYVTNLGLFKEGESTQLDVSFYDGVYGTGTVGTLSGNGTAKLGEGSTSDTAIAIVNTTGSGYDAGEDSAGELTVAAGTSQVYELKGTISGGLTSSGDYVTTRIASALTTSTTVGVPQYDGTDVDSLVNVGGTDTYFMWSDNSVLSHSAALGSGSADWFTDYLVKTLPTDYKTVQYNA